MAVTRRAFLAIAGAAATPAWRASVQPSLAQAPSVQDVMARALAALGGSVPSPTVDGLKAGRLDLPVTGIAVSAMATSEVILLALARGCNLVLSLEPTFFARADQPAPPARAGDAVFAAKTRLVAERGVAVWRLRDQWLASRPNDLVQGLADALGWQRQQSADDPFRVTLPSQTLSAVVTHVRTRLDARALRVVGDPAMRVSRLVLSPGPSAPSTTFANLATTDVILAGEPREWEGVSYVQDAITAGQSKAMIIAGRVLSEDPGVRVLATWLRTALPDIRVESIGVGDKYWRPAPERGNA